MPQKNEITVFKSKIKLSKESVTIKFPKKIIEYLRLSGDEIMWVPMNGTLQLVSASQDISIPLMPIDKENFIAH